MNTHDIELPPLPEPGEAMSKWAYDEHDMQDYARAAIEADRQARGEPVAWLDEFMDLEPISEALKNARQDLYGKIYTRPLFTAPQPQQIPEGYRLVPKEPTDEMNEEGCQGYMQADDKCWLMHKSSMEFAYKCMLAAAPKPDATTTRRMQ